MRHLDKHSSLNRARQLLDSGDADSLVYAALELRQTMEAVVYDKLRLYQKYVPAVVFDKWQPAHALKVLLLFEPDASEDMRVGFAMESEPGVPKGPMMFLGEHKFVKLPWLNKNYNRLSNYLHIPHGGKTSPDESKVREDLESIYSALEGVVNSSLNAVTLAKRVKFDCLKCKKPAVANREVVQKSGWAMCIMPECGAMHRVNTEGDEWEVELLATNLECLSCGEANFFENRHLVIGMIFNCHECNAKHIVKTRKWGYHTIESDDKNAN